MIVNKKTKKPVYGKSWKLVPIGLKISAMIVINRLIY
jgi:hypothetical protein